MTRNAASAVAFAIAIAAATVAAVIVSNSAFADEIAVDNMPSAARTATGPDRSHLRHIPADVLKGEFLNCERAAAQRPLDLATAGACSVLYEELRERVFGGSFDALIAWWGETREADAEVRHSEVGQLR